MTKKELQKQLNIDMERIQLDGSTFKILEPKIEIEKLSYYDDYVEVLDFIKLLNDNNIKSLETAKALYNEKINIEKLHNDCNIVLYNSQWYIMKEFKEKFPDKIRSMNSALSPCFYMYE